MFFKVITVTFLKNVFKKRLITRNQNPFLLKLFINHNILSCNHRFITTTHSTDQFAQGAIPKSVKPTKKEVVKKSKAKVKISFSICLFIFGSFQADSTTPPEPSATAKRRGKAVKEPENEFIDQRSTRSTKKNVWFFCWLTFFYFLSVKNLHQSEN